MKKIQPLDLSSVPKGSLRADPAKPIMKSRFKRLFERQFPHVLRVPSSEKIVGGNGEQLGSKEGCSSDFDPSSACLAKMVQNFLEESTEKQTSRNRCNCFNGNCDDSSDDDLDFFSGSTDSPSGDASEFLKSLVPCSTVTERNLLADTAKIIEKNKPCKDKNVCRRIVTSGLSSIGYDASICRSRWEKTSSFPAGEYEYIDVLIDGERLLIDVDFKSEFEIARSTKNYKAILQSLPSIFVGKSSRLQQIVAIVSEAAKQSLKKKGLHFPPWRKPEYMRAKWISPYHRLKTEQDRKCEKLQCPIQTKHFSGEFELVFGESNPPRTTSGEESTPTEGFSEEKITVVVSSWQPPAIKPRPSGGKIVTGLSSVLTEKP